MSAVRGTVQADILKEDQAQNTCIFSTEFALRMMGDIQELFVDATVAQLLLRVHLRLPHRRGRREPHHASWPSPSRTASPTWSTTCARGMQIDDFAPNLSFFFSNGMDPEYSVIGRVARRIWATAMREKYGANERSQKLKYHIQTSGRSLHAQEIAFNDIRTTLQALYAHLRQLQQPAHQRVRRGHHHPDRGVRPPRRRHPAHHQPGAGLREEREPPPGLVHRRGADRPRRGGRARASSTRISERGGVLGAMETMYQRGKIQEESLLLRDDAQVTPARSPSSGVNTFLEDGRLAHPAGPGDVIRSTDDEKQYRQIAKPRGLPGRATRPPSGSRPRRRSSATALARRATPSTALLEVGQGGLPR